MLACRPVKNLRLCSAFLRCAAAFAAIVLMLAGSHRSVHAEVPTLESGYPCRAEYPIYGGRFFTQTGGETGRGYAVRDDDAAKFWTAFRQFGGIPVLGYPVSQRFMFRGYLVQAFQKSVLQWDPSAGGVNVANTLDLMNYEGHDGWLRDFRQVPPHAVLPEDAEAPFVQIIANHLKLLDVNPVIREAFLNTPHWLTRLGLPIAYGEFNGLAAMRTQRAVLQQWLTDVPWARAGEVVFANSGDLAKEAGMFPADAVKPVMPQTMGNVAGLVEFDSGVFYQGDVIGVRVRTPAGGTALAWDGQPLPLLCYQGEWRSVIGVASTAELGGHRLAVSVGTSVAEVRIDVTEREFPSADIELPAGISEQLGGGIAREERELVLRIVRQVSGPPLWNGPFDVPSQAAVTSVYGERRTLHPGSSTSVHEGIDFSDWLDAPVRAPNDGRVVWAEPLAVRGNTVIIDHGFGVFTLFYHLNEIGVLLGGEVQRGDTVGLVGSTGRSTGPHLHWEMYVAGAAVDPRQWVDGPYYAFGDAAEAFVSADLSVTPGDSNPAQSSALAAVEANVGGEPGPVG